MRRNPRQIAALVAASTLVAGMLVGGGWLIGHSGTQEAGPPAASPSTSAPPTASPAPVSPVTPAPVAPRSPTSPSTQPAAKWRLLPPAPVTEWKYGVMAVWTGTEMLVYHAYPVPDEPASTAGYAYNPTTSRWRKLAPIPAPPEVSEGSNSAVWTGTEMIVEGLVDAAYNPATNTWRPVNTAPYNSGGGSVTVWTGRQVLKWGGGCCGDYSASGSAYVPDTNRWYPLPASPLAGRRAAGTWTGTEMVIVGGEGAPDANIGGTKAFADAAAYNPVTRTWRRLPSLPAPRKDATATWTGTEVLVVGGQAGAPSYQMYTDGVAYNPATNRWRRIPAMPVGRVEHAAIWTGHQLLVWGGRTWRGDGWTTPLRGYAYNPARNRWTPMPTSPLRARVGHAAVWTGSRMLIWGGEPVVGVSPNAPAFVDGATYRP